MARAANPRQPALDIEMTPAANASASDALSVLSEGTRDIMRNYNLSSANPDVLVSEIRGFQISAVDAMFNIGVRLLVLRQVIPHGEWMSRLEDMGMNARTAQRIQQATIKFADPRKARSEKLLTLGKAKLLELLVLDDESIDVLDSGGDLGELGLDEISRMPTSELRAALRESRAAIEAKDTLIQTKNDKIDELDTKLRAARKFKPAPGSDAQTLEEQALLDEVTAAVRDAELAYARLAVVTASALERCANQAVRGRVAESLRYVHARMEECAKTNGFEKLDGGFKPAWDR